VLGGEPFIGFTGLAVPTFEASFTPCTEVGWRLAFPAWGNGYATEAAQAALAFGFGKLALKEIVALTAVGNIRSRAVMERLGMRQDGEFDHPRIAEGNPVRRHVIYRLSSP
jgi:ribosomal-protein-alanine N-acetyltransferase